MKRLPAYLTAVLFGVSMLFAEYEARAEAYGHSVGVRLGNHFAADYKFYLSKHSALDFTFGLVNPFSPQYQFLLFSSAYDFHIGTGLAGLTPYIGGGFSIGTQFGDRDASKRDLVNFFLSVDIPVGLEYALQRKPVVFFLEWSPKVQLVKDIRFIPQSVSLGIRFVFPGFRKS